MKISNLAIAAMLLSPVAIAQDVNKSYIPTEVQSLRLQVRQDKAVMAKANFDVAVNDLQNEAIKVKKDNNWPDSVTFDLQTLTFSESKVKPETKK